MTCFSVADVTLTAEDKRRNTSPSFASLSSCTISHPLYNPVSLHNVYKMYSLPPLVQPYLSAQCLQTVQTPFPCTTLSVYTMSTKCTDPLPLYNPISLHNVYKLYRPPPPHPCTTLSLCTMSTNRTDPLPLYNPICLHNVYKPYRPPPLVQPYLSTQCLQTVQTPPPPTPLYNPICLHNVYKPYRRPTLVQPYLSTQCLQTVQTPSPCTTLSVYTMSTNCTDPPPPHTLVQPYLSTQCLQTVQTPSPCTTLSVYTMSTNLTDALPLYNPISLHNVYKLYRPPPLVQPYLSTQCLQTVQTPSPCTTLTLCTISTN